MEIKEESWAFHRLEQPVIFSPTGTYQLQMLEHQEQLCMYQ